MFGFNKTTEEKHKSIIKKIDHAIDSGNGKQSGKIFAEHAMDLYDNEKPDLLNTFVLTYIEKIPQESINDNAYRQKLKKVADYLAWHSYYDSAYKILDACNFDDEAYALLASHGLGEEIAKRISKESKITKDVLTNIIDTWEKHNGDFTNSPSISGLIRNLGQSMHDVLPNNPRVKEFAGYTSEAAELYKNNNDWHNAARCFEKINQFDIAKELYLKSNEKENVSRIAELQGDFEEALEYVISPMRRIDLLIRLERFEEAKKYASSFADFEAVFLKIKDEVYKAVDRKISAENYVRALELLLLIDDNKKIEELLVAAREYCNKKVIMASSDDDQKEAYRYAVRVEELAGNYELAGKIAEEKLNDYEKASKLYEQANLFNRAINIVNEAENSDLQKRRLAELHEKGGNLLNAAKIYEEIEEYNRAAYLYEQLGNYHKAAECYSKQNVYSSEELASLYEKAGEVEKSIAIYLKSEDITTLEKAKEIAKRYGLITHEKAIDVKLNLLMSGSEDDVVRCIKKAKDNIKARYSHCLGIDFGTTNSVGAIYNRISRQVEIITLPGNDAAYCEPSYFGVDENNRPVFGERALNRSLISPQSVISRIKRYMGTGGRYTVGSKSYKAEEISAMIINRVSDNASKYLEKQTWNELKTILHKEGIKYPENKVTELFDENKGEFQIRDVVLTVPAFYNDNQKRATRDAAEVAGLRVLRLMHEPTAAAFAYGINKSFSGDITIIDLGGGTLDISTLDVGDGVYEVLDVNGDIKLGGSDIDSELVAFVRKRIKEEYRVDINENKDEDSLNRLRNACENLKINLSTVKSYTLELHNFLGFECFSLTITRDELDKIASSVLQRYKDILQKTYKRWSKEYKIKHVLLVGNATKMPAIKTITEEVFGKILLSGIDPGSVVASGAALLGAKLSGDLADALLLDITPYSLGIAVQSKTSDKYEEFSCLIKRSTTIPTKKTDIYTTTKDNQTEVDIRIYQGEEIIPQNDYFLGKFTLSGIAPAPKGEAKIEVEFDIGADCILTVTAKDQKTGKSQSIKIDGAVTLSSTEKRKLSDYFNKNKQINVSVDSVEKLNDEINKLFDDFDSTLKSIQREKQEFEILFHEKVEVGAKLYKASAEDGRVIQEMFMNKDSIPLSITRYQDRVYSLRSSMKQYLGNAIDYSNDDAKEKIQEKVQQLEVLKKSIKDNINSINDEVLSVLAKWNSTLRSMKADYDKMDPVEAASSFMSSGLYDDAREKLEEIEQSGKELNKKAFALLLECYTKLSMRDEYKDLHMKYGYLFDSVYPDFNRLDSFLSKINKSIVMLIVGTNEGIVTGTGFAIKEKTIVTNKHVVEDATPDKIHVVGATVSSRVVSVTTDPENDIAILRVEQEYIPMRIGEFNFVQPGEQVIAIGFPSPNSNVYSENVYISKGIVNSIRRMENQSERVIFIDAKIGSGMSGGPLINDLGEVIGINTMIQYKMAENEKGTVAVENQNIAISIHLIKKYL